MRCSQEDWAFADDFHVVWADNFQRHLTSLTAATVSLVDYGYLVWFNRSSKEVLRKISNVGFWESNACLSGIEAVRKIVETESQARKIVEDATRKAQQIVSEARQEADNMRQEAKATAEKRAAEILSQARAQAEGEARTSDTETEQLLQKNRQLGEQRKDAAMRKAVELVLGA